MHEDDLFGQNKRFQSTLVFPSQNTRVRVLLSLSDRPHTGDSFKKTIRSLCHDKKKKPEMINFTYFETLKAFHMCCYFGSQRPQTCEHCRKRLMIYWKCIWCWLDNDSVEEAPPTLVSVFPWSLTGSRVCFCRLMIWWLRRELWLSTWGSSRQFLWLPTPAVDPTPLHLNNDQQFGL